MALRTVAATILLALLSLPCHATKGSLLDPDVSLAMSDQPLHEVLDKLTEQTGIPFQVFGPDPKVSVAVPQANLYQVLDDLSARYPVRFERSGAGYRAVMGTPAMPAPSGPVANAGRYRLRLADIGLMEDGSVVPGRDLGVSLVVDNPTLFERMALAGLDPTIKATVDGLEVKPLMTPKAGRLWWSTSRYDGLRLAFPLVFTLPPQGPIKWLTSLEGQLITYPDLKEERLALPEPGAGQPADNGQVVVWLQNQGTMNRTTSTAAGGGPAVTRQETFKVVMLTMTRQLGPDAQAQVATWLNAETPTPMPGQGETSVERMVPWLLPYVVAQHGESFRYLEYQPPRVRPNVPNLRDRRPGGPGGFPVPPTPMGGPAMGAPGMGPWPMGVPWQSAVTLEGSKLILKLQLLLPTDETGKLHLAYADPGRRTASQAFKFEDVQFPAG